MFLFCFFVTKTPSLAHIVSVPPILTCEQCEAGLVLCGRRGERRDRRGKRRGRRCERRGCRGSGGSLDARRDLSPSQPDGGGLRCCCGGLCGDSVGSCVYVERGVGRRNFSGRLWRVEAPLCNLPGPGATASCPSHVRVAFGSRPSPVEPSPSPLVRPEPAGDLQGRGPGQAGPVHRAGRLWADSTGFLPLAALSDRKSRTGKNGPD